MMELKLSDIKGKLYTPPTSSHKGQNGKLLIIGGSHLFHAASLWALKIASKIVDMVFYYSVPENLEIVNKIKKEFHDGIVVPTEDVEEYINQVDCILVGPGMERMEAKSLKLKAQNQSSKLKNLREAENIEPPGLKTKLITHYLLKNYPDKRFVIDAGSLQMMEPAWLENLKERAILTPHYQEFQRLFNLDGGKENIREMAKKYNCVILLKGPKDVVCSPENCKTVTGGNAGMTKGGTGDVLAGLTAALYCKNEAFLSACVASYVNKKAGEKLFARVSYYFNASDLITEIPKVLKELI